MTTEGRHLNRRIAALAVPALGSIAAEPLYTIADTAIVGHLGRVPLASLAIAASALAIVAWVAIFLSTATTSSVARLKAGGGDAAAGRSVGAAYLVAVAWGVAMAVIVVIAAPWAASTLPRWMAASAVRQTLSRYHESADKLTTPMMAGAELKPNCLLPMENSLTRAEAADRFFSSSSESCSRFSTSRHAKA